MKRSQVVKRLRSAGCELVRHGSRQDIWHNPKTGQKQPIPRHREVDDQLVRHIFKFLGIE